MLHPVRWIRARYEWIKDKTMAWWFCRYYKKCQWFKKGYCENVGMHCDTYRRYRKEDLPNKQKKKCPCVNYMCRHNKNCVCSHRIFWVICLTKV